MSMIQSRVVRKVPRRARTGTKHSNVPSCAEPVAMKRIGMNAKIPTKDFVSSAEPTYDLLKKNKDKE